MGNTERTCDRCGAPWHSVVRVTDRDSRELVLCRECRDQLYFLLNRFVANQQILLNERGATENGGTD